MSVYLSNQPDPATVSAALSREVVPSILLLELRFASGTVYMSNSATPFEDEYWGHTWAGLGNLVSISTLEGGPDNLAPFTEFGLGIPWELLTTEEQADARLGLVPALVSDRAEYVNRVAILWDQILSDTDVDAHGRPAAVGIPSAFRWGLMDKVSLGFSASQISMTMTVEGPFARKGAPVYGRLADRDQQNRHPGDRGLRYVPEVLSTSPVWTDW